MHADNPPSLGDLQQLAMLAVARLGEDAYGGAIQDELREVARREVSVSTVYVTLVRLEEQGLVESHRSSRGAGEVGRPRRRFVLTGPGWDALRASRVSFERMWEGVEPA